jgi:hypothetical protein
VRRGLRSRNTDALILVLGEDGCHKASVRLSILTVILMLAAPAFAVELFRYRGASKEGGTLEYVFEAGGQVDRILPTP